MMLSTFWMNHRWIIIATLVAGVITFALRALPFLIFGRKRQMPEMLVKLGQVLPSAMMAVLIMDFSLLSPLEFFVDPKNGDGRNNKPPAMRVRVDCYTKKLPFRLQ